MTVDICIPVYKPDDKLKRLISGLSTQTVKPRNIIIMYTMNNDHLSEEFLLPAQQICNVKVIELKPEEFDHGGTRKQAMAESSADVVIMMTMDAIPANDFLIEQLLSCFLEDKVAAAYARQLPDKNSSLAECFTREFNYPKESCIKSCKDMDTLGIKTFFCSNVCAAYRNSTYRELGGFVEKTIFNEDMIFSRKIIDGGYKIYYCAEAMVIHTHNYSAMMQFHRNFDLAVSQAMFSDVFDGISSESEGFKYVKKASKYFIDNGKAYLIIPFVYNCGWKYLGYKLGKKYKSLPMGIIKACAMNKRFFEGK